MMENDNDAFALAAGIAQRTLDGRYDLLLACRDLAALRLQLSNVPEDVMDTFVAVSSEVDALPIGDERQHWSPEALRKKDAQAENYRVRVREVVNEALQELLMSLGGRH